ncbi:MAG: hypothetical protein Q8N44_20130 [Rubrivivax sp.]|nr:hypothetical protein [Rubrivivax sp.]
MNLQANFDKMMLGVRLSPDLTDVEKEYIIELLTDQLRAELGAQEYTENEP